MGVRIAIISGDGINAHEELQYAFNSLGGKAEFVHVNELLEMPSLIHRYSLIAFPGGFSFGDEIRSGKIFAIKLKSIVVEMEKFISDNKLVLGICNGFQILTELGLFSSDKKYLDFSLVTNSHGEFKNFWTEVKIVNSSSPWLKNLSDERFYLPVRHKEGRIYGLINSAIPAIYYLNDINGSLSNIAGVTDITGHVLGLMPHPEAAIDQMTSPEDLSIDNYKYAQLLFKNAILYLGGTIESSN